MEQMGDWQTITTDQEILQSIDHKNIKTPDLPYRHFFSHKNAKEMVLNALHDIELTLEDWERFENKRLCENIADGYCPRIISYEIGKRVNFVKSNILNISIIKLM